MEPIAAEQVLATGLLEHRPFAADGLHVVRPRAGSLDGARLLVCELARPHRAGDPVALISLENQPLPSFSLRPAETLQADTQNSAAAASPEPRFDQLYVLRDAPSGIALETRGDTEEGAAEEQAAYDLFDAPKQRFFEQAENLSWLVVSDGRWLGISVAPLGERRHALEPRHIAGFVEDVKLVYRVLRGESIRPGLRRT